VRRTGIWRWRALNSVLGAELSFVVLNSVWGSIGVVWSDSRAALDLA
jgi:hypothetical protein